MQNYIIVDLETTGLKAQAGDKVIQFAAVNGNKQGLYNAEVSLLINPGIKIPPESTYIHGISDDIINKSHCLDYKMGITFIHSYIKYFMGKGFKLMAYNSAFDLTFLKVAFEDEGLIRLYDDDYINSSKNCVMKMAQNKYRTNKYMKLVKACQKAGVITEGYRAHNALDDCKMAFELLRRL